MSGRIRTIKPELLEDEKTANLSHLSWRVFVGLFLVVDDYGNCRANLDFLWGQLLWAHPDDDIRGAVDELRDAGLISIYSVRGQSYLHVSGWEKHQKVDRPGKPRVPGPEGLLDIEPARTQTAYIIRGETTGLYKIGKSYDPLRRIQELSAGASEALSLLAIGGVEAELHKRFAKDRVHGEWFRRSGDLDACVGELGGDASRPIFTTPNPCRELSRLTDDLDPDQYPDDDHDLRDSEHVEPESPTPLPQPAPSSSSSSDLEDRETPISLTFTLPNSAINELAERYKHPAAVIRDAVREFRDYWAIGYGTGKRRAHWARRAREDIRKKAENGKLDEIAKRLAASAPQDPGQLAKAEAARTAYEARKQHHLAKIESELEASKGAA